MTKTFSRVRLAFALATAVAFLGATPRGARAQLADSVWPVFQQNLSHTGQSPLDGPTTNDVKWIFHGQQQLRSAPSVGTDGTIFIGNGKAPYCAVNPGDGTLRWCSTNKTGGDAAQSQPAVSADGLIYAGARDNDLWAIFQAQQPTQEEQVAWRFHVPTDGDVTAPPIIGPDGIIYFASNSIGAGSVYAFFPADAMHPTGTQKWLNKLGSGVHNSSPTLSLDGSTLYISTIDSMVHALDVTDGHERWSIQVFQGINGFRQSNFTVVQGPNGRLYVGARDGLHALDPNPTNTGVSEAWNFPTVGRVESSAALANDGTLYVGSSKQKGGGNTFYAINPDGTEKWSVVLSKKGRFQNCEAVVGANGTIYVAVASTLYSLSPADGSTLWSYTFKATKVLAPPVIGAPGVLYVPTLTFDLYAFAAP
jgi:outer membrane protein assembly factor BamB